MLLSYKDNNSLENFLAIIYKADWNSVISFLFLGKSALEHQPSDIRHLPSEQDTRLSLMSCDLYDGGYEEKAGQGQPKNMIPWDKLAEFFKTYLK